MMVFFISVAVIALGFALWVLLSLTAPTPKPHPLTGMIEPPDILWWLKTPDAEPRPTRKWEWLIAHTAFGLILAGHWVVDLFRRR